MDKIEIRGREYEILKIYKKKQEEKDLLLCRDLKSGCKECFQRCDIYDVVDRKEINNLRRKGKLTNADMKTIEKELLKKTSRQKIIERFNNVPRNQVVEAIKEKRKELGVEYKQKADGTPTGRVVLQYDKNMNLIARYSSSYVAESATGVDNSSIRKCCNGTLKTSNKFIWKYEEGN